jgi:hypothetical protein
MIRIDVRSASGASLESLVAEPGFDPVLQGIDRSLYPILGHLDPYGDTILNRMQVRTLLEEIDRLGDDGFPGSHTFKSALMDLCQNCLAHPHQFLWFIGE